MPRPIFTKGEFLEADGMCVSMISVVRGPERVALVLKHENSDRRMYYYLDRDEVSRLIDVLADIMGKDA